MPEPQESFARLDFPEAGLDLSGGYARQRPGTTPVGANVRTFDPKTDRARGASRPGLVSPFDRIPEGDTPIQHLNVVVICTTDALLTSDDPTDPDPITGLPPIDDPSSPGPSGSWGPGVIVRNPMTGLPEINPDTGLPYTGAADGSRNPGGTGSHHTVFPRHVRDGGNAVQPNKNQLLHASGGAGPHACFQGNIQVHITHPAPDPFGWDGTEPAFPGVICAPYNPPAIPGPATAAVTKLADDYILPLGRGTIPKGTLLLDVVALYLSLLVGSTSSAAVIVDQVGLPGTTCTGFPCTGAPPPSINGTSVGVIILPA